MILIIAFSGYKIISIMSDYKKAADTYNEAEKNFVKKLDEPDVVTSDSGSNGGLAKETTKEDGFIDVDIEALKMVNPDDVAWIYFENEDISYPVLYSGDDTTYLRTAYTGEHAQAGSIFIEGANSKDFSDAHTIVYGHNMNDLSMFGKLKWYKKKDYFPLHRYFQIITEKKNYRYEIFAYKEVEPSSDIYTVFKDGNDEFEAFVKEKLLKGSLIKNDIELDRKDHILTLSTCGNDSSVRFVVSAVRIEEMDRRAYEE
jgi:sortase B